MKKNAIDNALLQMEILYKCRCVQPPFGLKCDYTRNKKGRIEHVTLHQRELGWDQKK